MKNIIKYMVAIAILISFVLFTIFNEDKIDNAYKEFLYKDEDFTLKEKNPYYRNYNFNYVKNTETFIAKEYQDIINIYYTGINSGQNTFEFKCDTKYTSCIEDVQSLANNNIKLSEINNFVHPYNQFKNINTTYNNLGLVTVKIDKAYTDDEIEKINEKIWLIWPALSKDYNPGNPETLIPTIKTIHDYIINTTIYDKDRSDNNIINYKSDTAYGPLFEGYALCGGYTDLMQLFLELLEVKSYRVSGDKHIWNAINIDNKWYNLDLTWDDPVTNTGQQLLLYDYFIIDSKKMLSLDTTQHIYNTEVFNELSN